MTVSADPEAAQLAAACAGEIWRRDVASRGLGLELVEVAPGYAVLRMKVTAQMINGHGTCHGGFIFTLADSAFAIACNSRNERSVAQHCTITYIVPGAFGDELAAEAVERARSGRSGITDVTVRRGDGTVIAEFRGHSRTIGGPVLEPA